MPSVTINGQTYQWFLAAYPNGQISPSPGVYFAMDPYGNWPSFGSPRYKDVFIQYPGVFAIGCKRLWFSGRPVHIELISISNSIASAESAMATIFDNASQLARYTIAMPGGTSFGGCHLLTSDSSGKYINVLGGEGLLFSLDFMQLNSTGY
ncbi:MAG TPA: hypothetical protein VGP72_32035 [Planctomycetota bacterium]|jgi:hypothetical protein